MITEAILGRAEQTGAKLTQGPRRKSRFHEKPVDWWKIELFTPMNASLNLDWRPLASWGGRIPLKRRGQVERYEIASGWTLLIRRRDVWLLTLILQPEGIRTFFQSGYQFTSWSVQVMWKLPNEREATSLYLIQVKVGSVRVSQQWG